MNTISDTTTRPTIDAIRTYNDTRTPEQLAIEQMNSDLAVYFMTHNTPADKRHFEAFQDEFEHADTMASAEYVLRLERWMCLLVSVPR